MEDQGNIFDNAPTAPELVLDLLVADGGTLSAAAICRAGALMGIEAQVVRVALTRLLAQGKIIRSGRGSYVIERRRHALADAVDRWWRHQHHQLPWQGGWIAVIDGDVRRQDQKTWRRHQLALQLRGFAALSPGLWLRPDNLRGGVKAEQASVRTLGLAPQALVVRMEGLDAQARNRADRLWDSLQLPQRYSAMADSLQESARRLPAMPLADATRESLLLGRHTIAALLRDPLLPAELMDGEPREHLTQLMRSYQRQARKVCRAFLAQTNP